MNVLLSSCVILNPQCVCVSAAVVQRFIFDSVFACFYLFLSELKAKVSLKKSLTVISCLGCEGSECTPVLLQFSLFYVQSMNFTTALKAFFCIFKIELWSKW